MAQQSILPLIQERRKHSEEKHKPFLNTVARRYDWYRGIYRGTYNQQWRNQVHIAYILALIQRDVASKAQTAFGAMPPVEFVGPDSAVARKNTALIAAQLEDDHSFEKAVDLFLSADIYGTGFARYGWLKTTRKGKRRTQQPMFNLGGMGFGPIKEKLLDADIVTFDGPHWDVVDILDSFPQPGVRTAHDARWWCFDYILDFQDCELYAEAGMFDKDGVARLRNTGDAPGVTKDAKAIRYNLYRSAYEEQTRKEEKFARPVYLTDMIGYVPNEFSFGGGVFKIVTMANNNVILRCEDFELGEIIPILAYAPMRDPHFIHGIGKIEAVEKLQALINKTASQKADALDFNLEPPIFVNSLLGLDDENLNMRAGRIIKVDGSVDESQLRQFVPDMRGFQAAHEEIASYWNDIQIVTGQISDVTMGIGSVSRESATGFSGRQEGALTRQLLEIKLAEKGVVEPLANAFAMLNQLKLPMPRVVRMIGMDAIVDPITGLPTNESDLQVMGFGDLDPRYAARAVGASQMITQAGKQQQLMQLLGVLQQNPVALQAISWANMLKYTFRVFGFPNVNDFLVKAVPAINQMADQAGVDPMSIAGALGGPPQAGIGGPQVMGGVQSG